MSKPIRFSQARKDAVDEQHALWLRYIGLYGLIGVFMGVGIATAILFLDINHIGTMIGKSHNPWLYRFLIGTGFACTFGMVSMGTAIMFGTAEPDE